VSGQVRSAASDLSEFVSNRWHRKDKDRTQLQLEFPLFEETAVPGKVRSAVGLPSDQGTVAGRWTETTLLEQLWARGAKSLERVVFRANRSTIWSLTRSGTSLNLHEGFRGAPTRVIDGFAVIVTEWRNPNRAYRRAAQRIRSWPGLADAMRAVWERDQESESGQPGPRRVRTVVPGGVTCAGTAAQRRLLRGAFAHFNLVKLDGLLPGDVVLRFSSRMTRRLGQMLGTRSAESEARSVSGPGAGTKMEIALSIDLLLDGNEGEFVETLLHEMAHAADFLTRGKTDHGPKWKAWARRVGCDPRSCTTEPVMRRSHGREVNGVPSGLRAFAGPDDSTGFGSEP